MDGGTKRQGGAKMWQTIKAVVVTIYYPAPLILSLRRIFTANSSFGLAICTCVVNYRFVYSLLSYIHTFYLEKMR